MCSWTTVRENVPSATGDRGGKPRNTKLVEAKKKKSK